MRTKLVLFVLLLSTCVTLSGQQSKTATAQKQPQKTTTQILKEQQEAISQLQADNEKLQAGNEKLQETNEKLLDQLDRVEKEIEIYREDVRTKTAEINASLDHWLTILAIYIGVFGIIIPLIITLSKEKSMEKMLSSVEDLANSAKEQANSAETKAKDAQKAVTEIGVMKDIVSKIQTQINKDKEDANRAAQRARASQMFSEAINEKNYLKAIELYKKAIELNPNDAVYYNNLADTLLKVNDLPGAMDAISTALSKDDKKAVAYITRGQILLAMNKPSEAIFDLDKGLSMDNRYRDGFESRAQCLRELAQKENDEIKKADLLAKARADEEKAQSMKQK